MSRWESSGSFLGDQSPAVCPASEVLSPDRTTWSFSAPDQPHIRSPFATAAPTSRLRRAGLRKTRTFLENGVSRPRPASVRPPGSVRTDYLLRITVLGDVEDGAIVRQA